jgi:hypothetical protein
MGGAWLNFWGLLGGGLISGGFAWVATYRSRHELKPNGGGSIKDHMNTLVVEVAALKTEVGGVKEQADYILERLDDHLDYHLDNVKVQVSQTITRNPE